MHVSIIVLLLPESVRNVTNKIALYRRQSNGIHMKYMQGRRFNLRLSDQKKKIVSEILVHLRLTGTLLQKDFGFCFRCYTRITKSIMYINLWISSF